MDAHIGGNRAWAKAGYALDTLSPRYANAPLDRFARPYNGIHAEASAMRGYLDWAHGLVAQLERDGAHGFRVIGQPHTR